MKRYTRSDREKNRAKKNRIIIAGAILGILLLTAVVIVIVNISGPEDLKTLIGKSEKEVVQVYGKASKTSGQKLVYEEGFVCVISKKTDKVRKVKLDGKDQKVFNISIGDANEDVEKEMKEQGGKLIKEKTISFFSHCIYHTADYKIEVVTRNNLVSEITVTAR